MSSTAIATLIKMMETLPEPTQHNVVEHLCDYIEDLQDELKWDATFKKTQSQLKTAAQQARQEIAKGNAKPMDIDRL